MFALRFNPTEAVTDVPDQLEGKPKKLIPLKRNKSSDDEKESDDEEPDVVDSSSSVLEELDFQEEESSDESAEESEVNIPDADRIEKNAEQKENKQGEDQEHMDIDTDEESSTKHSMVFSRFQQTLSLQDKMKKSSMVNDDGEEEEEEEEVEQHDLESIPQPARVRDSTIEYSKTGEHKDTAWKFTEKIHYDNSMIKSFDDYKNQLDPKLLKNIQEKFSTETFPIQTILLDTVLPSLNFALGITKKNLTRRVGDILVNASTGSGKTLAYSIPILQALIKRNVNKLRAIIIVPTKLLINQVFNTLNSLASGSSLIISTSRLESSLNEEHQKLLANEPDIVVVTPGRLVDHLQMGSISVKNLKFLVLDEADRLLNQSFQNWCNELLSKIRTQKSDIMPGNIIKMVFSATLTTNTEKLHSLQFYHPKLFVVDSVKLYNIPKKLQEFNFAIPTAKSIYKPLFLLRLLDQLSNAKVLVFVKSNQNSLRLTSLLSKLIEQNLGKKHTIESVNSNNSRGTNRKIVNDFSDDRLKKDVCTVLITTDIMSRGIDINNITDVINYDLPISSQQYVHRVGRTARAGTEGTTYNLLVGKGERKFWTDHINVDIARDADGYKPKYVGQGEHIGTETDNKDQANDADQQRQRFEYTNPLLEIAQKDINNYKDALSSLHELTNQ
ncbi:hypothetical protein TPHA_0M01940 [Tetrapisispora phaffii CBS 4417]|uniref:ATP-dependent RNA helicase n=1 Tax=Tetrapisispora phaffii (strain ATCC 24235 / CBS 4417 / NBRC 1672 / NRRL Y-8282 / UCD 70-5) TaxID=1071381 RepID=G8C0Q4_TETPH|nr:hypothetical protein TPHA_0M01940 [Tetrapisispora phaffii CBS 4417]CCE65769.1 hypothetical protein TPHA_0M01940 [Tetrapisispora phaffii CBS 4417]